MNTAATNCQKTKCKKVAKSRKQALAQIGASAILNRDRKKHYAINPKPDSAMSSATSLFIHPP